MDNDFLELIGFQHLTPNDFRSKEIELRDGRKSVLWVNEKTNHGVLDSGHWISEVSYRNDYREGASANSDGKKCTPVRHFEMYSDLDRQQFERVKDLLGQDSKVLEVGCSYGGVLNEVMKHGVDVCHAIEPNSDDVRFVRETIPDVIIQEGFFLDLDLPTDYYDVIMGFQVLEHVQSPRLFLEKIFRLLKKGGALHLEVPNHNAALLQYYDKAQHSAFYYHQNHIHYFTGESIVELCKLCGFEGEIQSQLMYPFFNHVYWHFMQQPQKTAEIALKTPVPASEETEIGRSINRFFRQAENKYEQLIKCHDVGDILVYQGRRK